MYNHIKNKILVLLVLLAFTVNTSFSQKNFRPGYIIKNSGDTLYGLIDYKYLEINSEKIVFKQTTTDSPITYQPKDIKEFGINKDVYISAVINTETLESKNDTVFLQTLFNGRKNLYCYNDNKGIESFFIKRDGRVELLVSRNYIAQQDGTYKIEENKKYIDQLTSYLSDCSKGLNLKYTSYSKNGLINLFDYYYKYKPSYNYYRIRKVTTEFGAIIGASLTNIEFDGNGPMDEEGNDTYDYVSPISFGNSIRPSAGLFFNLILPWNQKKWSINNELMFSSYNLKGNSIYQADPVNQYNIDAELSYTYLKINNLIRYTHPIGSASIFVNGGISTGWAIVEKQKVTFENSTNSYKRNMLHNTRIKEHGFIIGSGIKYSKYSFEFRYELGDGMEVNTDFTSTTKRYFALIGYTF